MNTFLDRNYNSSLKKKQKENSKNGRIRTSKSLSLHKSNNNNKTLVKIVRIHYFRTLEINQMTAATQGVLIPERKAQ